MAGFGLGPIIWIFLIGGAVFVLILLFVASTPARPVGQAVRVLAAIFTTLLFPLVFASTIRSLEGPVC